MSEDRLATRLAKFMRPLLPTTVSRTNFRCSLLRAYFMCLRSGISSKGVTRPTQDVLQP